MKFYWFQSSLLPTKEQKRPDRWKWDSIIIPERTPPRVGDKALDVLLKWDRTKIRKLNEVPKKYKLKLPEDFLHKIIKSTFLQEMGT